MMSKADPGVAPKAPNNIGQISGVFFTVHWIHYMRWSTYGMCAVAQCSGSVDYILSCVLQRTYDGPFNAYSPARPKPPECILNANFGLHLMDISSIDLIPVTKALFKIWRQNWQPSNTAKGGLVTVGRNRPSFYSAFVRSFKYL